MLITESEEEKTEITHRPKSGVFRGSGRISEAEIDPAQDVIDDHTIRRLPWITRVAFTVQNLHRKPLMAQRFSDPGIDVLTEVGDRGSRRRLQNERYNPSHHSRQQLRLRADAPADGEVEHHLFGTVGGEPVHQ